MYCNLNQLIDVALGKQKGGGLESLQELLPPSNYPKRNARKNVGNSLQELLPPSNYPKRNARKNVGNSLQELLPPSNYPKRNPRQSNSLQELLAPSNYPKRNAAKKQTIEKILGKGSFGEVTLLSGLPKVDEFKAILTTLEVNDRKVSIKHTNLTIDSYLRFQSENESNLVAKYFIVDIALKEEADAIKLMLGKMPGKIIEDCAALYMINSNYNQRNYYYMIEVLGKKFLLYRRMDTSLDKVYDKLTQDEKKIVFYRTAIVTYAFEYHALKVGCFHRDIKPANILCKKTTLSNGNPDFLILIGDFGLFTDGNEEQYGFSGTPKFMCFRNLDDMEDRCAGLNITTQDTKSLFDIGMFVNDTYAYILTLEYLLTSFDIKELKDYLSERKNALFNLLNTGDINTKEFTDLFVIISPHPKHIVRILLETVQKVSIKKINNPDQTVYVNSFVANIALHELDMYMKKNNKTGIFVNNLVSIYRPKGNEFDSNFYLNLEGPFAYTYLFVLILNNIPERHSTKKDFYDYLYNYNPQGFTLPNNVQKPVTRIRKRMT